MLKTNSRLICEELKPYNSVGKSMAILRNNRGTKSPQYAENVYPFA